MLPIVNAQISQLESSASRLAAVREELLDGTECDEESLVAIDGAIRSISLAIVSISEGYRKAAV